MYLSVRTILSEKDNHDLFAYAERYTALSKCLYNAALFRVRQIFTGYDKPARSANEAEVFEEVRLLEKQYPNIHVKRVISYSHLEKLMRVTQNPDFFAGLPMQSAQWTVKQAVQDFKNWLAALKEYRRAPGKFLGRPKMPGYRKHGHHCLVVTNQDAVLYPRTEKNGLLCGSELKLPLTKERLPFPNLPADTRLMEVKIVPYYGRYQFMLTYRKENADQPEHPAGSRYAAIDFGVENIAAIVSTDGTSRIYKGGAILSENRRFALLRARYTGILTKGHKHMQADSKRLRNLSFHHANFNRDQMHKISSDIIRFCAEHQVHTLVLGVNRGWKQKVSLGRANNQNFVSVPTAMLRDMIRYKAERNGILVVEQEESYTSKADITAKDPMPVYSKEHPGESVTFSGKRTGRGLYRCFNNMLIHADCNGAANILRKAFPDAWNCTDDFSFLGVPEVIRFHDLNHTSIPVRRIAAA